MYKVSKLRCVGLMVSEVGVESGGKVEVMARCKRVDLVDR
jgi:hypothetical protein